MQIIVVRHAIAEEREAFAKSGEEDDLRPLTREGRRKMRKGVRGLIKLAPVVSVLATSPLVRAVQTGQIIAGGYGRLEPMQIPHLVPRKPLPALLTWVQSQPSNTVVMIVGHEPQLGMFASWLLTGLQESFMELKKGGACAIELAKDVKPGRDGCCGRFGRGNCVGWGNSVLPYCTVSAFLVKVANFRN